MAESPFDNEIDQLDQDTSDIQSALQMRQLKLTELIDIKNNELDFDLLLKEWTTLSHLSLILRKIIFLLINEERQYFHAPYRLNSYNQKDNDEMSIPEYVDLTLIRSSYRKRLKITLYNKPNVETVKYEIEITASYSQLLKRLLGGSSSLPPFLQK